MFDVTAITTTLMRFLATTAIYTPLRPNDVSDVIPFASKRSTKARPEAISILNKATKHLTIVFLIWLAFFITLLSTTIKL